MQIDKDVEKKLVELLIACGVTFCTVGKARTLISAGVTVDPNLKHCYQCKNFLSGGDWYLCCSKKYDLCYKTTNACDMFDEKVELD